MAAYSILISGISPLLQHRFSEASELPSNARAVHVKRVDPRAAAEAVAYRTHDGELYLPGGAIARLLREAGSGHKQTGSRKSLRFIVPSAVIVLDDQIILRDSEGIPLKQFEVDSRPVVIPSTRGRIMRHRPRLNNWHAEFTLEIDDEVMDPDTIHQLLAEGGKRQGVGDNRPAFGRFHVVKWMEFAQKTSERKPISV